MSTVSLIIPVYNTEKWLKRCLNSILVQTFTDYEVILIDDGSTDSSPSILDEYAKNDSRLTVFHEKNRGSSQARKFGMSRAQGEWFMFIDSDDDVHPTYVQSLYETVTKNNLSIAACDMQRVGNNSFPVEITHNSPQILNSKEIHTKFFNYQFWGFWGKIYHKSVFKDLYFPEHNINEDYVVMAQIFHNNPAMAYIQEPLYYYRTNPSGQSHVKLTPRIMEEFHNKNWVREYYEKNNPTYVSRAKAQQVETTIKLINIIKREDSQKIYSEEMKLLKTFLQRNIAFILFQSKMLFGLKYMALKLCF